MHRNKPAIALTFFAAVVRQAHDEASPFVVHEVSLAHVLGFRLHPSALELRLIFLSCTQLECRVPVHSLRAHLSGHGLACDQVFEVKR